MVEVFLLELFCLLLHRGHLLRRQANVQLALYLQQKRMTVVHVLAPQFLQFLHLKVLLVVLLGELINRCAEPTLESGEIFLEVLRNDQSSGLLHVIISVEFADALYPAAADDVGDAVGRIVDFSHHQSAVILAHLGVQVLWGAQKDVSIERAIPFHGPQGLIRKPDVQLPLEDIRINPFLVLVNALELLGPG